MPAVARRLGIATVSIVPYYYVPEKTGLEYEDTMKKRFGCTARSWRGFHHDQSGMDPDLFRGEWRKYLDGLSGPDGLINYPYMAFSEDEYRIWFEDATTPVGLPNCPNVEKLMDVQPGGEANFCVDFPDYSMGNVGEATMEELWNGDRARDFREFRRSKSLPICHRCGAKYMSVHSDENNPFTTAHVKTGSKRPM